ncbi:butyrate kinase [Clostridium tagluense]|uniref:Probable butyrate kinase n=1 Tax=Clostridium tagluense TaxID=360422 RepID=A0A401UP41_9CLOT|nr:butyrate kinase [Clostridium tagluense]GCD11294.1 putative butyrate kinase [Clostridium tagluense]
MKSKGYILVINPGSTSTKLSIFKDEDCVITSNLTHSFDEIKKFEKIYDQKDMRTALILQWLDQEGIALEDLIAVVGRGGLLRPMPGGTYEITPKMLEDLKIGYQAEHASNLGGVIAFEIARKINIPAFIVDPVAVDEILDVARISGLPEIPRRSLVHALNIKAVTRRVCTKLHKNFEDSTYVVAHIGGGISVSPVKNGRILDVNNANEEGPFSPERTGGLPVGDLAKLAFSGEYTLPQLKKKLTGEGGLVAYLNTNDGRIVDKMIDDGDKNAELIFKAMAYQIAKEIGAMATVVSGKIDAIILTGGLAYNKKLTTWISDMVSFIAKVELVPGEDEMLALAQGTLRILKVEEKAKIYEEQTK